MRNWSLSSAVAALLVVASSFGKPLTIPDKYFLFHALHLGQVSIGFVEVLIKEADMKVRTPEKFKEKYQFNHPVSYVHHDRFGDFVPDGHHELVAQQRHGGLGVWGVQLHDWSHLDRDTFLQRMIGMGYLHLADENGDEISLETLLNIRIETLRDDPYRTLAWLVRKEGGYDALETPFQEFRWAQYFRTRLKKEELSDWVAATRKGLRLAAEPEAKNVLGYHGIAVAAGCATSLLPLEWAMKAVKLSGQVLED